MRRSWPPLSQPVQTDSSDAWPRATTRWSASTATRSREGSANASPSRAALLINPPILILDDATSAIDVKVEQRIHSGLRVLMEDRTTLIVAHRLSTISLADRVVVPHRGQIVADGTHIELLASTPLYSEILAQAAAVDEADATEDDSDLGPDEHLTGGR